MRHKITLIPGDGIGPEISLAMRRSVEATGVDIKWEVAEAGGDVIEKYKTPLPDSVIDSIKKNGVAIKGPVVTPVGSGFRSVNVRLRQELDLFACVRPCKLYKGVRSNYKDVDIVVIRENTEDLYAGIEFEKGTKEVKELSRLIQKSSGAKLKKDTALSIKPISESASRRIVEFAFTYARKNNRKKVTAVHKANIMKYTDGLFLEAARDVAKKHSDIEFEDKIVDNMCMQLVQKPNLYDVLVLPNLYGDIISDLCAGLVGGLGVTPGANIGDHIALFEPTHGSAPKYKGQNKVNPTAMLFSAVLMLRYIGEGASAEKLENAVAAVIKEGKHVTYDLKKDRNDPTAAGTREMTDAIIAKLNL
ncbi:MAG: isocitrate/isopropylmalate dehydrogenase family protein [Candidatus Omnitrophota bacterium]|nr:MAG: isocitrate/isopropylmalate dehydrogenase family protein [Candidatus Omnitrophota bacterium]